MKKKPTPTKTKATKTTKTTRKPHARAMPPRPKRKPAPRAVRLALTELARAVIPPANSGSRPLVGAAVATQREGLEAPLVRTKGRAVAELTGWCQVRLGAELAAAVRKLPAGMKSTVVRVALERACRDQHIDLASPPAADVDPNQLSLPIGTALLHAAASQERAARTVRVLHTDGTLGTAHPVGPAVLRSTKVSEAKRRPLLKLKPVTKARARKVPK